MRSKGNFDQDRKEDLDEGYAAATSILHRANDAIGKEQRLAAVSDLSNRVEDWKGHKINHFGDLLLYGKFTVVKGEGTKPVEREVCSDSHFIFPGLRKPKKDANLSKKYPSYSTTIGSC